ncbi:hypothetical protein GQ55_5G525600 [Panicum hallii var. hallii]|uniref:Esterase n=2 Tax=Panicum hallii TaxID=206008 RepID=A0A2T7DSU3_9POAL|nr:GDSL esterase/lipase At1g28600-like isoform X2 [Panicum hallii]PAN32900.1 hypothetical protein PAHAL_5G520200 [Panicum hallii]PUZ58654.1 hypothetical protein GQ55_5G525600 [Panicum hallii var. hallii]
MLRAAVLIVFLLSVARIGRSQSYNAIYSFGDSISDTGNLCAGSGGCPSWDSTGMLPYGRTHFGHPTGRCTDGRVIVDFLAERFGLPLLPPSKASGSNFKKGANMAIIGATTMDFEFFRSRGLGGSVWNDGSLGTQIQWFQQLMPSICGSDCKSYFSKSLFVVGEFGGNDYNAALFNPGKGMAEARSYVPQVVDRIASGVEALIGLGAAELVVPGVLPIGCFPVYLTLHPSSNKDDYDETGCLRSFNSLSSYHNELLKRAVSGLRSRHAGARIMYADFYAQVADMVRSPETFGLEYGLRVCCGAGGQGSYNYNNGARCGTAGASACGDPEKYLVWDGVHLTDAAYRAVAGGWLRGTYCSPGILH